MQKTLAEAVLLLRQALRLRRPQSFISKFETGERRPNSFQILPFSGCDELYRDRSRKITEVACWAHVRRKHFEAQSSDLMRSTVILAYIRLLYDVEREARNMNLDCEARKALRYARSVPILIDIKTYLEREQPAVLPKSPEGMAISYTLSNWDALVRYCDDGDLEIDNNGAERSLRGIAIGRQTGPSLAATRSARRPRSSRALRRRANGPASIRSNTCATCSSASAHIPRTTSTTCCLTSGRLPMRYRFPDPPPSRKSHFARKSLTCVHRTHTFCQRRRSKPTIPNKFRHRPTKIFPQPSLFTNV